MQYGTIAQAVGILTPAFASGYGMCSSHIAVSSIKSILGRYKATDPSASSYTIRHALTQFNSLYDTGKRTGPWIGALASSHLAYLAYLSDDWKRNYYAAAAALPMVVVPFTLLVLKPTNDALFALRDKAYNMSKADDSVMGVQGELNVSQLLDKWISLNYIRQLFPLAASFLALWVTLQ